MEDKKLDILKDLLVSEEHTLEDLQRLVQKSKEFIKIESKNGKGILSASYAFTISEKLALFLIGSYFSHELGLSGDKKTSREVSEELDIPQTTLSGPLGEFVRAKTVSQESEGYKIKFYEIEKILDSLNEKYIQKTKITSSPIIIPKKKNSKKPNKNTLARTSFFNQDNEFDKRLGGVELTKQNFDSLFNLNNGKLILLRGYRSDTFAESHLKATLLILTANNLLNGGDELSSSTIRDTLQYAGVANLTSLSTTLKDFSTMIIHRRGPIGSTNTSYQISGFGLQNGILLIKDILENTSNFKVSFQKKIRRTKAIPINLNNDDLEKKIMEFAKDLSIESEDLKKTFDFQNDGPRLLKKPAENNRKQVQIKSLMLLGIVIKKIYGIDNFNGKIILKNSNIAHDRLDLLDSNKEYQQYFSKKPKTAMELNYNGQTEALNLIKNFLSNEKPSGNKN